MTDLIVIVLLIGMLAAALGFGVWLGRRAERARQSATWQERLTAGFARPSLPNIAGDPE